MTAEETLLAWIVEKNQATLTELGVALTIDKISFGYPVSGTYQDGNNTMVVATIKSHPQIQNSSNTYYYSRNDLETAFASIGETNVSVSLNGAQPDVSTVLNALLAKYNFQLNPKEVISDSYADDKYTFTVTETSLLWTGSLAVTITDASVELSVAFPNQILDGFSPPDFDEPIPA